MTNEVKIQYLRRAGICFIITGIAYLAFGFPFWFLGAVDEDAKGKFILPFLFLKDNFIPQNLESWVGAIGTISMLIGVVSLWQTGEPTGMGQRKFFYVSIAGAFFYILGQLMPLPFAPLGAFLSGLGMIIVGIASLKSNIWIGWKRYIPLIVGCFPFIFMFPLLILTGSRPAPVIGFWGFPWIVLGLASWLRSKELR